MTNRSSQELQLWLSGIAIETAIERPPPGVSAVTIHRGIRYRRG